MGNSSPDCMQILDAACRLSIPAEWTPSHLRLHPHRQAMRVVAALQEHMPGIASAVHPAMPIGNDDKLAASVDTASCRLARAAMSTLFQL